MNRSLIEARLVSHWGNTFGQRFFMRHGTQTTNLASINRSVLARLPVPIIPVAEQKVIMREVDRRLAAADKLEKTLNRQLDRAGATRESLLREAFVGKLVPQDPNDASAPALLDRIRAARAEEAAIRKTQPKPRRGALRHQEGNVAMVRSFQLQKHCALLGRRFAKSQMRNGSSKRQDQSPDTCPTIDNGFELIGDRRLIRLRRVRRIEPTPILLAGYRALFRGVIRRARWDE